MAAEIESYSLIDFVQIKHLGVLSNGFADDNTVFQAVFYLSQGKGFFVGFGSYISKSS